MHKAVRIKSQKLHGGNTCRCLMLQSEFEWCRADATLYLEKKYTQASHAEMLNCSVNVNLRTSVTLKANFFGLKNELLPKVNFNFLFGNIMVEIFNARTMNFTGWINIPHCLHSLLGKIYQNEKWSNIFSKLTKN